MTAGRPMSDQALDQVLAQALRREAEAIAVGQPDADVALMNLSRRVAGRRYAWPWSRRVQLALFVILLVGAGLVAVVVGSALLERRPPFDAGPLGLGYPCAVELDPGTYAEIRSDFAPGERVITYFDDGLVSETTIGGLGLASPGRPRGLAMANTLVSEGRLSDSGRALVSARLGELELTPGCYDVGLLPGAFAEAGTLTFRTAGGGAAHLRWKTGTDIGLRPMLSGSDNLLVHTLMRDLFRPDMRRFYEDPSVAVMWLPAEHWSQAMDNVDARWLAHVMFTPTDYGPDAVLQFGDEPPASATDGRYAAVKLPAGASPDSFGEDLDVADGGRRHRCAVLGRIETAELIRSLEGVELGVDAEADLFTPDMAWGVDIELMPASSFDGCDSLATRLREVLQPAGLAPTHPVEGDLAALDPCALVPDALKGQVDPYGYVMPGAPFGVAARSCVLERRATMGVLGSWTLLWLYPRTISEAEATTLATSVLGNSVVATTIGGRPAWLNHCFGSGLACVGGVAMWLDGRFLLLEISAGNGPKTEPEARAREVLERIAADIERSAGS